MISNQNFHTRTDTEVAEAFGVIPGHGLGPEEIALRVAKYGRNTIEEGAKTTFHAKIPAPICRCHDYRAAGCGRPGGCPR